MKKNVIRIFVLLIAISLVSTFSLIGCKQEASPEETIEETVEETKEEPAEEDAEEVIEDFDIGIEPLIPDGKYILPIQATGPNGEEAVGVEEVLQLLDADDIQQIMEGGYTAAIAMASSGDDWTNGQIEGITDTMEKFNIEVVATTLARWTVEQQIADVESIIQLKPSILFTHTVDGVAVGPLYKQAADAGIKVVFIDSPGADSVYPDDYASVVQADNYVIAKASVEIMIEMMGEEGQVALINYKNRVPHMDMREAAARETIAMYPNITIAAEQRVGSNDEGATVAEAIITGNPDIEGIWVGWDGPAMSAAAALESLGKQVYITAPDLGRAAALSIASDGLFVGSGAQHPWDQGVAAAVIGMAAVLGIETPNYVIVPGEKVVKENLEEAWERIYHIPLPDEIADALNN